MSNIAIFKYFVNEYPFINSQEIANLYKDSLHGIFKILGDEIEIHIINLNDLNGHVLDVSIYSNIWLHSRDIDKFTLSTINIDQEKIEEFSGGSIGIFPYKYIGDQDILNIKIDLIPEFIDEAKKQSALFNNNRDNGNQNNFLNELFK